MIAERSDSAAVSRDLWKGLVKFNREQAGPLHYKRTVLSVRDGKGRLLGGLILAMLVCTAIVLLGSVRRAWDVLVRDHAPKRGFETDILLRSFNTTTNTFGAPTAVTTTGGTSLPAIVEDASGALHIVWRSGAGLIYRRMGTSGLETPITLFSSRSTNPSISAPSCIRAVGWILFSVS